MNIQQAVQKSNFFSSAEGQVDVFQVPPRSKLEKRKVALGSQMRK